jgi:RNA polymerase sigma factor (sigma-70 family)
MRRTHPQHVPSSAQPTAPAARQPNSGDAVVLLRRAQAGDRDAFGQLVRRYIAARTRDQDAIADLVQDTFVTALQNLDRVHDDVHGWLLQTAATMCARHAWAQRRYLRAAFTTGEHQRSLAATTASASDAPARRMVADALAALAPRQRLILRLRFLDGHGQATTARIVGCSRRAVRRVQHNALRQLEARLSAQGTRHPGPGGVAR